MQKNVLNTDLSGKVAVVTGAGGVLCSCFAKALARAGAKVALLDLNYENANKFAQEIIAEGGVAKAYSCNVLDKDICNQVANQVLVDLGPCDILLNVQEATFHVLPRIRSTLNRAILRLIPRAFSTWRRKALNSCSTSTSSAR